MTPAALDAWALAGQRIIAGFDGRRWGAELKNLITSVQVGGLILFARNLGTPEQIRTLCREAQRCAADCGQPPLFIAIDQEGGSVARLKPPFTQFPDNCQVDQREKADRLAKIMAEELGQVGINMNMAPVLDVAAGTADSIMKARAFPGGPDLVAELGSRVISGLQKNGIMAVAKHFPGIGRTTTDSHLEQPRLSVARDRLEKTDLVPFRAAIREKVAGLMLSHVCYPAFDPDHPASLSAPLAGTVLRDRLGFDGLVMTDDLDMGAIVKHYSMETVVAGLDRARVDVALICHAGPAIKAARDFFLRRYAESSENRGRADQAVARILAVKARFLSPPAD